MCGRYDLSESPAAIRAEFHVPEVPAFAAGTDLRPTQMLPIVRLDRDRARECVLARWGLVPHWAPDLKFGSRCFNARCETLAKAPAFRSALRSRRCLVPLNAFYEWSGPAGRRVRHRIAPEGQALFALAGLWERWGQGDVQVDSYTIITCPANEVIAAIHGRMPVILDGADRQAWLEEPRAELLRPYRGRLAVSGLAPAPAPAAPREDAAGAQLPLF
jgi:putative SOS response-associated peptidase YedK